MSIAARRLSRSNAKKISPPPVLREPFLHPFSETSPWNLPAAIGATLSSSAELVNTMTPCLRARQPILSLLLPRKIPN